MSDRKVGLPVSQEHRTGAASSEASDDELVMIKTGIYGLLRTLTFLGEMPAWWGWTVLGIGAASGVVVAGGHDRRRSGGGIAAARRGFEGA